MFCVNADSHKDNFSNVFGLLALAAASPRLRSRREAGSRSRASWTLSAHGATMAAIVYELYKRLAFQLSMQLSLKELLKDTRI